MVKDRNRLKIAAFWCLSLVPLALLLEVGSYLLIVNNVPARIKARLGHGTIEARLQDLRKAPIQRPEFIQCGVVVRTNGRGDPNPEFSNNPRVHMFHSALGWDFPPDLVYKDIDGITYNHDPDGARRTCTTFRTTPIATYGDSFTYCANVDDNQTWQTHLANKLGVNILNFGVGGYGTDQACLKYQLNGSRSAKIVMLGILPENINRVVNIFRPFYVYEEPWGLTKPMFVKTDSGFRLIPNPLDSVLDIGKLSDPTFLNQLGQLDYWYCLDKRLPSFTFPYVFSLYEWRKYVVRGLTASLHKVLPSSSASRYQWNLFEEPQALGVMCHIVDLFVNMARARGAVPIVVMMPHKDYVTEAIDNGVHRADNLVQYLRTKKIAHIDAIRAMAQMKPTRSQLERWYEGHATPEGNRVLADIIFDHLDRDYAALLGPRDDRLVLGR
ncbi:MAG TPA: hypothetical protein VMC85_04095 [Desulfomonilaceae bacterium]|nr:hypothetical protein [Desulfomonilaceae bacterium]